MEARTVEIRAEGRRLRGVALPYRSVSESHRERFLPGSIEIADSLALNLRHNELQAVAYHPGGGLEFRDTDSALEFTADLLPIPAADAALEGVRSGRLSGASVEFLAHRESRGADGIRVIEKATLAGLALVQSPSYQTSVEVRRRKAAGRARVRPMPENIRACGCVGPACDSVKFAADAFREVADLVIAGKRELTVHTGRLDALHVLGSTAAGAVAVSLADDGALVADLTAAAMDSPAGEALAASVETSAPIVRPLIDDGASEFTESGAVRTYTVAMVSALLVKVPKETREGWEPFELPRPPRKRRIRSLLL